MPDLPDLPAAAHQATDQAKELARKGAQAANALLDASFHPFRTVRGLVQGDDDPVSPPPTDVQPDPVAAPEPPQPPAPRVPTGVEVETEAPPDLPVVPTGPAPHIRPDIAEEIERDYGDELPGFRNGDEPPGTH